MVTIWSNLFIYLYPEGRLRVSQSLSLDSEESESDSALEKSLLESQRFLESISLIFLVFLSSWHDPDFLVILKSILFWFLGALISFLRLLLYLLYCFTASSLLPIGIPSPYLMVFWLVCFPKQSSELYDIYFCSGIPALLQITPWSWVLWCLGALLWVPLLEHRTPVLAFFFLGILTDPFLSDI